MRTPIPLLLALSAMAAPALAQTAPPTRDSEALTARAEKAAAPTPQRPGRVERALTTLETNGMIQRMFTPRDGFGVRIAGIKGGSALAAGPSWRASQLAGGLLQAHASAAASTGLDTDVVAELSLPRIGRHLGIAVTGGATHLANERFFGIGADTQPASETSFAQDIRHLTGRVIVTGPGWLTVSGAAGTMTGRADDGRSQRVPAISTRFIGSGAPGLAVDSAFTLAALGATVDYRDVPRNPRSGGRYHVAVSRYASSDRTAPRHSFTRVDVELEQHLSAWKRQRLVTLRAVAASTVADPGHDVPFYLQPTLGGSRLLRGFVTDRFRDRTMAVLQAEYGWDVTPFLNALAFYEAGTVAHAWKDIGRSQLRRDYGFGFRFGSARTVAFRTDVALGSGEGPRLTMRMNHAF
jgi:hypothetical protein